MRGPETQIQFAKKNWYGPTDTCTPENSIFFQGIIIDKVTPINARIRLVFLLKLTFNKI